MCRGWRFAEPQVPGAIAPVPATPDMTQEVGIRNCKLYTKPGDAVVSEFEERLEAVEDATADNTLEIDALDAAAVKSSNLQFNVNNPQGITQLENIRYFGTDYIVPSGGGGGGGGNAGTLNLAGSSIMANPDNPLYCILSFTYNTSQLPSNATIDSFDIVVKVSGGTVYRGFTLYRGEGSEWVVSSQEGSQGVSVFSLDSGSSGGVTVLALRQTSNSLWLTNIAAGDTIVSAKMNYHV